MGMVSTESFILGIQKESDKRAQEDIIVFNYNISPVGLVFTNAHENLF
jgi:hypothetical protein